MKIPLFFCLSLLIIHAFAQSANHATITVNADQKTGEISTLQYGQFIEHLGRAVNGGIYDEHSPLSDQNGFRKDVMEKVKELKTPLLRYPGGTFTKIYHWEDGVGPKANRKKRKNLIWGGIEDNHFGTDEFISYCRKIGAEPFLVVNMATGTPEEAANWVEYCNGTGDTYYANLRRANGFIEPFNVKYWGIGNEEYAQTDVGRDQDVQQYIKDTWLFVKMMKLQDNALKLVLVGNSDDVEWTKQVLDKLSPVCDYLAVHLYSIPQDNTYPTLIRSIDDFEKPLLEMEKLLKAIPAKAENFNSWYRFPARKEPVKLAVDEWGIWDIPSKKGKGLYQMEYQYNWSHALAVASFLNLFQRHSAAVGMATWAQTVNVLAPIMSDSLGSYRQTVFTPLKAFRDYAGKYNLQAKAESPEIASGVKSIDVSSSLSENGEQVILTIVNRDAAHGIHTAIKIDHLPQSFRRAGIKQITYTAKSLAAENSAGSENAVKQVFSAAKQIDINENDTVGKSLQGKADILLPPASLTVLLIDKR